jgi:hypothetical protein
MPPVARNFVAYFALVQSLEQAHCTKGRKSGASASNDHRISEKGKRSPDVQRPRSVVFFFDGVGQQSAEGV